jgi:hypothetical protein
MARRRKAKRTRRRKTFSLLNAAESFGYATILSQGIFRTNPVNFVLGDTDLSPSTSWTSEGVMGSPNVLGGTFLESIGGDQITLGDILKEPGYAFAVSSRRAMANAPAMAIQSIALGAGFRIMKRLLRAPLNNVNRNIVKPVLGAGVRI